MSEATIQKQICAWLRMQHPNVIFTSESSGVRLPIGLAKKVKQLRSGSKLPDLIILEPRANYHGMCVELKSETPWKMDGTLKAGEHLLGQWQVLKSLEAKGYRATFAAGFENQKPVDKPTPCNSSSSGR